MADETRSDDALAERRARLDRQIAAGRAAREILELHRQGEPGLRERSLALLSECADTDTAPPPELVQLIGELLRPERNHLPTEAEWREAGLRPPRDGDPIDEDDTRRRARSRHVSAGNLPAFRRAARFEAAHPPDPEGKRPSTASLNAIAEASGADRKTIREWRDPETNPVYWREVEALRRRRE